MTKITGYKGGEKDIGDMKTTLQKLIEQNKFNWFNPDITEDNFPDDGRRGKVKIINFGEKLSSEEVLKRLDEKGYRPATIYELLEWNIKNKKNDYVVAFGSVWRDPRGDRDVAGLWGGSGGRRLYLDWFENSWHDYCRFAAVRKSNTLELGTFLGTKEQLKSFILVEIQKARQEAHKFWKEKCNERAKKFFEKFPVKIYNRHHYLRARQLGEYLETEISKAKQEEREKILEAIPTRKFPEKESDEFDAGYAFCREQIIKFLENEKTD